MGARRELAHILGRYCPDLTRRLARAQLTAKQADRRWSAPGGFREPASIKPPTLEAQADGRLAAVIRPTIRLGGKAAQACAERAHRDVETAVDR